MRHLKYFENRDYKIGELVKLKLIPNYVPDHKEYKEEEDLFSEITGINPETGDIEFELYNGKKVFGNLYLVRRDLKEKEIEIYNRRKEANKYNL